MKFKGNELGKAIVIITGVSCSGKTTLAKKLETQLEALLISVDDIKTTTYDEYGFANNKEHGYCRDLAHAMFRVQLMNIMRFDKPNIIVEYPFADKWQSMFDYLCEEYGYYSIIVDCVPKDLNTWLETKIARDSNYDIRHKGLVAKSYIMGEMFEPVCPDIESERRAYLDRKFNRIRGDYYTDLDNALKDITL